LKCEDGAAGASYKRLAGAGFGAKSASYHSFGGGKSAGFPPREKERDNHEEKGGGLEEIKVLSAV